MNSTVQVLSLTFTDNNTRCYFLSCDILHCKSQEITSVGWQVGTDFLERGGIWGKLQRMGCTCRGRKKSRGLKVSGLRRQTQSHGNEYSKPGGQWRRSVFVERRIPFGGLWFLNYYNAMLITTNCRWMKIKVMITLIVAMHCLLIRTLNTCTISYNLHNNSKRVLLHIFCS